MRLIDQIKPVLGAFGAASSLEEDYVAVKQYDRILILLATTLSSGSAVGTVTLKQATTAAGGSEKELAFTKYWKNEAVASGDTLTETDASSNQFTVGGSAVLRLYAVEVKAEDLDTNNGFCFVRADVGDITNGTVALFYLPYQGRRAGQTVLPTAVA